MRSGLVPIVCAIKRAITATGLYSLHADMDSGVFPLVPHRWALQVTGTDSAGTTKVAPTAWDVILQASLDGLAFNDTSKIVEHVNGTNANGDVVWPGAVFLPTRYAQLDVKTLTLGSAAQIYISVLGFA